MIWGDPPVFANNCLIGLPESPEPEATLNPVIKTEECQYRHSQPAPLKALHVGLLQMLHVCHAQQIF